jgi:hypothetical protein
VRFDGDPANYNNFAALPVNGFWVNTNPQNSTVQLTKLAAFVCPSDVNRITFPYGTTNYAANAGADAWAFDYQPTYASGAPNLLSGPFCGSGVTVKKSSRRTCIDSPPVKELRVNY